MGYKGSLVSRRGHIYQRWPMLETEIAHAVRAMSCVLDGEIVALTPDGRSKFYDLMFRREWFHFVAFDVLSIGGEDLRELPLIERKRRLRRIMPRPNVRARLLFHDDIDGRGIGLFDAVLANDLEGVVAKWKYGRYHTDGQTTSWFKIRNPAYTQSKTGATCSSHAGRLGVGRGAQDRCSVLSRARGHVSSGATNHYVLRKRSRAPRMSVASPPITQIITLRSVCSVGPITRDPAVHVATLIDAASHGRRDDGTQR